MEKVLNVSNSDTVSLNMVSTWDSRDCGSLKGVREKWQKTNKHLVFQYVTLMTLHLSTLLCHCYHHHQASGMQTDTVMHCLGIILTPH